MGGMNSFSKAVELVRDVNVVEKLRSRDNDIKCIFLKSGMHDELGEEVVINFAIKVVGQNKDDVKIRAGLAITGNGNGHFGDDYSEGLDDDDDISFSDLTVTGAKGDGVGGEV